MYNRILSLLVLPAFMGIVAFADDSDKCCCCPKEPVVELLIGPGLTRLGDDYVDFKEVGTDDKHLFIDNDSRFRAQLMTGVVRRIHRWKGFHVGAAFALEFSQGGQNALDSAFFGISGAFPALPQLEFVGGYSRGLGKELSPGFKHAMVEHIKNKRKKGNYLSHIDIVDGEIAKLEHFDGLPLYDNSSRIFPGDPVINSFNSKWSFGVLFRLDPRKIFSSK